jgi:hypothetical protein
VLQAVFQTEALSFTDWLAIIALTSVVLWVDEVRKMIDSRRGTATSSAGDSASRYSRLLESDGQDEESRAGAAVGKGPGDYSASMKRRGSDVGKEVLLTSSNSTPAGRFRQ